MNDNSACPLFLFMSSDPYFYFVFLFMEGNSATFQNILILLGNIIEWANMDCNMQLCWSLFF